jgi:hypothetical protein
MKLIQKLAVVTAGFVVLTSVNASPVGAFSEGKTRPDNFANNATTILAQTTSNSAEKASLEEQQTQSYFWTQTLIWFAGAVFFLAGIPSLALFFLSNHDNK